jgi:hypothetical protein
MSCKPPLPIAIIGPPVLVASAFNRTRGWFVWHVPNNPILYQNEQRLSARRVLP